VRRLALVALCLLPAAPARAAEHDLLLDRPDLWAHFAVSYGLSLTLTTFLAGPAPAWGPQLGTGRALAISTAAVGALGLFKEFVVDDEPGGDDLIADAIGLATCAGFELVIHF
jgi:hypothetical protein